MQHSETTRTGDTPASSTPTTPGAQENERPVPATDERADRPERADVLQHPQQLAHVGEMTAALTTLRERTIPRTLGAVTGVRAEVSGMTAQSKDFNDTMKRHLPYVFAFVLGLAFLLLMVTFRSIVVPLVAIMLNLLSVAAAYGALKLIFQDGHGERVLGFQSIGGVVSWLPLFLFVILFGLSMDYHVFIVSRIREVYDRGWSTPDAVTHAIRSTAGVVTSAAVVMVAVFSIFATLSSVIFKQVGVALAIAVLLDATIVRAVLLPSVMKLLGDRNWYLPRWLEWVPQVRPEQPPSLPPAPATPDVDVPGGDDRTGELVGGPR